MLMYWPGCT